MEHLDLKKDIRKSFGDVEVLTALIAAIKGQRKLCHSLGETRTVAKSTFVAHHCRLRNQLQRTKF